MKKRFIISSSAVLFTVALLSTMLMSFGSLGIQSIHVSDVHKESFVFNIGYADCSGFSVKYVGDESVYRGETAQDLDEYLLPHRIKITLSDCKVSKKFEEKYSAWQVYDNVINEQKVQFMWCYNNDHGITLFLASESILNVNEQAFTKLMIPAGKISIKVGVSSSL